MKIGTFLMVIVLAVSAMTVLFALHTETDASSEQIIDSGYCGPNATYRFYSDGTLEISGSGQMYSYISVRAPWYEHHYDITKIVIGDNITKLGEWAFIKCKEVKELTLPITLNPVASDTSYNAFTGIYHIEKFNFTGGNGGYGYNYAAYQGTGTWYQDTPWYQCRDSIKEIVFADGVKRIGNDAFRELNMTSVVLSDSVVNLGNHCFFNCTKLTDLTIPVSLNSYGSDDTYPAFRGCTAIEKVTFTNGNGVPFDYKAWNGGVKNTGLAPWNMYSDVPKTIVITDSVTELGEFMFWGCNLKELTFPISINLDFGGGTWYHQKNNPFNCKHCNDNLEKVTLTKGTTGAGPDYWNNLNACPWNNAPNLKTVIFEEGITRIGENTLYYCNFEDLILPNSLVSFGDGGSFKGCTIKNLTIPISVNASWLGEGLWEYCAFDEVSGIEKVTFTPGSGYGFNYAAYEGKNCWYQNTPWYQCRSTLTSIVLEKGIISIGSDAFRELNLTSIVIPDSVCSLSNHTFYNCGSLTELTIPISLDSVASAEYPAFDGCNLEVVHFTRGFLGVGYNNYRDGYYPPWANVNGTSVTKMTFDSSICYIGNGTFYGCTFYGYSGEMDPYGWRTLGGMTFEGADGLMYEVRNGTDSASTDTLWSDYEMCGNGVIEAYRICHQLPNLQESLKHAIRILESGAGAA